MDFAKFVRTLRFNIVFASISTENENNKFSIDNFMDSIADCSL